MSAPVRLFFFVFKPLIWVLQHSSELAQRAIGIDPRVHEGEAHSEAELKMLLEVSTEHGEIELDEREMLYKVFDFAEKEVADVMVPRPDVAGLSVDLGPDEAMAAMLESPYTRYPVYRESLDEIVGIVHVRDLVASLHNGTAGATTLAELARPPYVVPENKDLGALLAEFRKANQHMAVVVDEYGAMAGIVTLEDVLEEIVGDIKDEHDVASPVRPQIDGGVIVEGTTPIRDVNRAMNWNLPDEGATTIAGLVISEARVIPDAKQAFSFHGFRFTVLRKQRNRIAALRITPLPAAGEAASPPTI